MNQNEFKITITVLKSILNTEISYNNKKLSISDNCMIYDINLSKKTINSLTQLELIYDIINKFYNKSSINTKELKIKIINKLNILNCD